MWPTYADGGAEPHGRLLSSTLLRLSRRGPVRLTMKPLLHPISALFEIGYAAHQLGDKERKWRPCLAGASLDDEIKGKRK